MLTAMIASLIFTVTYGTLAAKSRRAELVLVPLDILQSVPVLGYISFTVAFFMSLSPGRVAGAESRGYFRDLYEPSLEHDLQFLPVAAHCTS
jgi:NitT/TauT family transport system permease protein